MTVYELIRILIEFEPTRDVTFSLWHEDDPDQDKPLKVEDIEQNRNGSIVIGVMSK